MNNLISIQHIKRVPMTREAGIIIGGISKHLPVFAAQTTGGTVVGYGGLVIGYPWRLKKGAVLAVKARSLI